MNRIHALAASVIVALSAIFGVAAMATTTGIGEPKPAAEQISAQALAARHRKLNRAQAALRRARAKKPPPLPAVPAASRPQVITRSAPAPAPVAGSSFDDDHEDDDDEREDDDHHDDDDDEREEDDD